MNKNDHSYVFLTSLSMIFIAAALCSAVLTHRLVYIGFGFITQGGTLLAPFWFILGDIIAEIYGYDRCKQVIWTTLFCQAAFGIFCYLVIQMPYPTGWSNNNAYELVLGGIIRTTFSAFIAFFIGSFLNIFLLVRWKVLLKGKYFWLRSLGASTLSELIFTILAVFMIQFGKLSLDNIIKIIIVSYSIKLIYSFILVYPSNLLVSYIKYKEGIDVYDKKTNFNPLKF